MKTVERLIKAAEDEAKDAKTYAKYAAEYRDSDHDLAELYAKLVNTKTGHIDLICTHIDKIIKEAKTAYPEDYERMRIIWDWEHEKLIHSEKHLKKMMDIYRGDY